MDLRSSYANTAIAQTPLPYWGLGYFTSAYRCAANINPHITLGVLPPPQRLENFQTGKKIIAITTKTVVIILETAVGRV